MPLFRSIGKIIKKVGRVAVKGLPFVVGGGVGGVLWTKRKAIAKQVGKGLDWIKSRIAVLQSQGYTAQQAEQIANQEAQGLTPEKGGIPLWGYILGGVVLVALLVFVIILITRKR